MRSGYQFFGPGQLAHVWEIAANGAVFPDDHRDALLALTRDAVPLPAPVYFRVPEGEGSDPRWLQLVLASQSQCKCPARRILVPEVGRARFVPQEVPLTVTLIQREQSSPCLIVPHGGDVDAAHVSLSFDMGCLLVRELPWRDERPQRRSITFSHGATPEYHAGSMWLHLETLSEAVRRYGEVICYRTLPNRTDRVAVPLCSIKGVHQGPGGEGDTVVSVELDAGVTHTFVKPDEALPFHVCQA